MKQFYQASETSVIVYNSLIALPSPSAMSGMWNMGSLLGGALGLQMITGIFLSFHYNSGVALAFDSVTHMMRDVWGGWALRGVHLNGASAFFFLLYLHIGRGLYYGKPSRGSVWGSGVLLFMVTMATAFLGYVLPWGQMSLWGATVITSLTSVIPWVGGEVAEWVWGGFSVEAPTLTRFYSAHFLLPFISAFLVILHLLFLHTSGSGNPLGLSTKMEKIEFHPYFSMKDILGGGGLLMFFTISVFWFPWMLADPENFIPANPFITPVHIQPEWYFLAAYAILRSIPNKLGGVIALLASVLVLLVLSALPPSKMEGAAFYPTQQIILWAVLSSVLVLTIMGSAPVEGPFTGLAQVSGMMYFFSVLTLNHAGIIWDKLSMLK